MCDQAQSQEPLLKRPLDVIVSTFVLILSLRLGLPVAVAIEMDNGGQKDGARRYVMENYSWHRIVDRYEELYSHMLTGSAFKL